MPPQDTCRTPKLEICRETGKCSLFLSSPLQPFLFMKTCLHSWVSKAPNPLKAAASFLHAPKGEKKPQGSSFLTSHSILGRPQGSSGAGKDATKSDTAPMSPFQAQDHHPEVLKGLTEEGGLLPKTPAHPGETSPSC